MRIAYITEHNPANMLSWSGSVYFIRRSLEDAGVDIQPVGPLVPSWHWSLRILAAFYRKTLNKRFLWNRSPLILKAFARKADTLLGDKAFDAILAPGGLPLVYLKSKLPRILWTDATFRSLSDFYSEASNLAAFSKRQAEDAEVRVLRATDLALFTSRWALDSARKDYGVDVERSAFLRFGANLTRLIPWEETQAQVVQRRLDLEIQVLFVGVDWFRKGGPEALAVVEALAHSGTKCRLHVVGCEPPCDSELIVRHGFLSKRDPAQAARLELLYKESHIFLLPTRAEAFGLVFLEAAAHGLPQFALDIGGVAAAMDPLRSGRLFPLGTHPELIASAIAEVLADVSVYREACHRAHSFYLEEGNWTVQGRRCLRLIESLLASRVGKGT